MKRLHLCDDCRSDIEAAQREHPASAMSFHGAFLVRQEAGYCIASLPACDLICLDNAEPWQWREWLSSSKEGLLEREKPGQTIRDTRLCTFFPWPEPSDGPEAIARTGANLRRVMNDPSLWIREAAAKALQRLQSQEGRPDSRN